MNHLCFSYDGERQILKDVTMKFPQGSFTAIVGESGCGKSTIASILMKKNQMYTGDASIGSIFLQEISEDNLLKNMTYVSHQNYLFKGTVRENLLMGNPNASEEELWSVLEQVNLAAFLESEQGLDTPLLEMGSNFSGGQRQRLALVRALLHDSPIYIFDEATSNIDVESENDIVKKILELAQIKTVIMISHRLANVVSADNIYVLEQGTVKEQGSHQQLLQANGTYANMWNTQMDLENIGKEGV